jgi:hypothetical protein
VAEACTLCTVHCALELERKEKKKKKKKKKKNEERSKERRCTDGQTDRLDWLGETEPNRTELTSKLSWAKMARGRPQRRPKR